MIEGQFTYTLASTVVLALAGTLMLVRLFSTCHRSSQFNDYVKREIWRTPVSALKQALLDKAKTYSLPIQSDAIKITVTELIVRVDVDYRVPINLILYKPKMRFHTVGAGLLRK